MASNREADEERKEAELLDILRRIELRIQNTKLIDRDAVLIPHQTINLEEASQELKHSWVVSRLLEYHNERRPPEGDKLRSYFQVDFEGWTADEFTKLDRAFQRALADYLNDHGLPVKRATAKPLATSLFEYVDTPFGDEESSETPTPTLSTGQTSSQTVQQPREQRRPPTLGEQQRSQANAFLNAQPTGPNLYQDQRNDHGISQQAGYVGLRAPNSQPQAPNNSFNPERRIHQLNEPNLHLDPLYRDPENSQPEFHRARISPERPNQGREPGDARGSAQPRAWSSRLRPNTAPRSVWERDLTPSTAIDEELAELGLERSYHHLFRL